ncbi:MAG: FHA domain-containing protein [Anaerolineae bacterium]|nr:FHA domain-containing protein [Anaerolineae bacterium]
MYRNGQGRYVFNVHELKIGIVVMSGSLDGKLMRYYASKGQGTSVDAGWVVTIGRQENNDICLPGDSSISRNHARLHWIEHHWWLEDLESTNGTFVTSSDDFFKEMRVLKHDPIEIGQIFRVGKTFLRLQTLD